MPLTSKGEEIKSNMEKTYGPKKGESVFYASANKGTIKGVHNDRRNAMSDFNKDGGPGSGPKPGQRQGSYEGPMEPKSKPKSKEQRELERSYREPYTGPMEPPSKDGGPGSGPQPGGGAGAKPNHGPWPTPKGASAGSAKTAANPQEETQGEYRARKAKERQSPIERMMHEYGNRKAGDITRPDPATGPMSTKGPSDKSVNNLPEASEKKDVRGLDCGSAMSLDAIKAMGKRIGKY